MSNFKDMVKKKYLLIINIVVIFFIIIIILNVGDKTYIIDNKSVSYLEEDKEFVMPITNDEEQLEVEEEVKTVENSNIDVKKTKTLIDYQANADPVEYVKENQEAKEEGIVLTIDDNEIFVKNEQIIEQTKENILTILIPNSQIRENYKMTGEIKDYVINGKSITSISLENDITSEKQLVPKSKTITTPEELMFVLFHNGVDYSNRKYYVVKENQTYEQVKETTKLSDFQFFINNSQYQGIPLLKENDAIVVNKINPLLNIAVYYEYQAEEVLKYDTIKKKDKDLANGEEKVQRKGENGKSLVTYREKYENGKVVAKTQLSSEEIKRVVNKIVLVGTSEQSSDGFIWPMDSRSITCGFGCYYGHKGIDIQGGYGSRIYAAKSGTVATAGWSNYGGGYEVTINHGGGEYTIYSHMKQQPNVSVGQSVSQGDVIGYEGATGNVTGPHLHFEIRTGAPAGAFSGVAQNAIDYLP